MGGREYRGIRTVQHTYVRDLKGPWLLFDRTSAPCQMTNLIGVAEYSGLLDSLDGRLLATLRMQRDAFLAGPDCIRRRGYAVDANGTAPTRP